MLTAGTVWILSLPVAVGALVLIYVDHRYGQRSFGVNGEAMFGRVVWTVRQPQIYVFAAPALGLIADVVPVAARNRQPNRGVVMGAIAAFSVLGFGAWVQLTVYPDSVDEPLYKAMAFLAVLPVIALIGGWASTFKGGRPRVIGPLVSALAALLALLSAVLVGALAPIGRFELGPLFTEAQVHLTVFAGTIAVLGGLGYWATKIVGRPLPESAVRSAAAILLLGTFLYALPDALSGAFGNDTEKVTGIEWLNIISVAGLGLIGLGVLAILAAVLGGLRAFDPPPADPWDGHTLEWTTTSPPPYANFEEMPTVRSAEPLLDEDPDEEGAD
jgi:heme/copper-type cytochrome/quinol oxidase subunit 1